MIASLTGTLLGKHSTGVVLDVNGVGFAVTMSTHTLSSLPAQGDSATLLTYLHVREDELSLFGFGSAEERELFGHLITVSGVGPKVALAALSTLPPASLAGAIVQEDITSVSSIPGVGTKTARRICLELKDKVGAIAEDVGPTGAADDVTVDTRDALLAMGFSAAEVASALKGYQGAADDSQALLRHALKRLGGRA